MTQGVSSRGGNPISFGGFAGVSEFPDIIDTNEFPDDQNKGGITPVNQSHLKNLASYASNTEQTYTVPLIRAPSLMNPSGIIENLEKKLEKINSEIVVDRESQKSLYAKMEGLRNEKEIVQREMEKMKFAYEKRMESLKEELGNYNKLKLELEYKDQMYVNQKAFYEEELSRMEDEKGEIERRLYVLEGEIGNMRNRDGIEEGVWKRKYEELLEDMGGLEEENKRNKMKIEELYAENYRKEEARGQMIQNYEMKIEGVTQELLRNRPDGSLFQKVMIMLLFRYLINYYI